MNDAVECLVPRGLAPGRSVPNQRASQAIRVLVKIGECRGLRTDVSAAERIVGVSADREDTILLDLDGDAARRFAQRARGEVPGAGCHGAGYRLRRRGRPSSIIASLDRTSSCKTRMYRRVSSS